MSIESAARLLHRHDERIETLSVSLVVVVVVVVVVLFAQLLICSRLRLMIRNR
jgi:hypothetical protein